MVGVVGDGEARASTAPPRSLCAELATSAELEDLRVEFERVLNKRGAGSPRCWSPLQNYVFALNGSARQLLSSEIGTENEEDRRKRALKLLHVAFEVVESYQRTFVERSSSSSSVALEGRALLLSLEVLNLNNTASWFRRIGQLDRAREFLDKALSLLEKNESIASPDDRIVVFLNISGLLSETPEGYEEALKYAESAASDCEQTVLRLSRHRLSATAGGSTLGAQKVLSEKVLLLVSAIMLSAQHLFRLKRPDEQRARLLMASVLADQFLEPVANAQMIDEIKKELLNVNHISGEDAAAGVEACELVIPHTTSRIEATTILHHSAQCNNEALFASATAKTLLGATVRRMVAVRSFRALSTAETDPKMRAKFQRQVKRLPGKFHLKAFFHPKEDTWAFEVTPIVDQDDDEAGNDNCSPSWDVDHGMCPKLSIALPTAEILKKQFNTKNTDPSAIADILLAALAFVQLSSQSSMVGFGLVLLSFELSRLLLNSGNNTTRKR